MEINSNFLVSVVTKSCIIFAKSVKVEGDILTLKGPKLAIASPETKDGVTENVVNILPVGRRVYPMREVIYLDVMDEPDNSLLSIYSALSGITLAPTQ